MVLGPQHCQQKKSVMPLKSVFERINEPTGYFATDKNCQLHKAFLHWLAMQKDSYFIADLWPKIVQDQKLAMSKTAQRLSAEREAAEHWVARPFNFQPFFPSRHPSQTLLKCTRGMGHTTYAV